LPTGNSSITSSDNQEVSYFIEKYGDDDSYTEWELNSTIVDLPKFTRYPYTKEGNKTHMFLISTIIDEVKYAKIINFTLTQCTPH